MQGQMEAGPEGSESQGILNFIGCGRREEVGLRMSPFGLEEAGSVATIWIGDARGGAGFCVKMGDFTEVG